MLLLLNLLPKLSKRQSQMLKPPIKLLWIKPMLSLHLPYKPIPMIKQLLQKKLLLVPMLIKRLLLLLKKQPPRMPRLPLPLQLPPKLIQNSLGLMPLPLLLPQKLSTLKSQHGLYPEPNILRTTGTVPKLGKKLGLTTNVMPLKLPPRLTCKLFKIKLKPV